MDKKENEDLEINRYITEDNKEFISDNPDDIQITTSNNANISSSLSSNENVDIKNKYIRFADKHCFGITALVGCIYVITSIFATISFGYSSSIIATILYLIYVGFFFAHIIFWIGLSIYYKDIKYFGHLLLGFLIGFFTCGGLFFTFLFGSSLF